MPTRYHQVEPGAPAERLDRLLAAAWPDLSRSRLQALIRAGHVLLGGTPILDPSAKPTGPAEITLDEPPPVAAEPSGEVIPLDVVFEDGDLVVIEKPAGLVVHPGAGNETGTLVNALLAHCGASLSGIGGVMRPGIVHRLDKDTSGLLVVAKNDLAHQGLAEQFADHGRTGPLERAYLAFCWGVPEPPRGTIEGAIARSNTNREKMAVVAEDRGRHAITHYEVQEVFGPPGDPLASLVRCELETGRTHQIRVHLAFVKHPLLGDQVYGGGFKTKAGLLPDAARRALEELRRQALHATLLQFEHPRTGELMRFESELPPDLARLHAELAMCGSAHRQISQRSS